MASLAAPAAGPVSGAIAGALAGGGAAVMGVLVSAHTYGKLDPSWVWAPVQAVGLSFTTAGLIARLRRPGNGIGWLMTAVGISWYTVDLRYSAQPALFAVGFSLFYLSPVIFTHLVQRGDSPAALLQREDGRETCHRDHQEARPA